MYNLDSELESVVDQLDATKRVELEAIKQGALGLMTLHSISEQTGNTPMELLVENTDESEDENSLGIFNDDNIHADLRRMNYKVSYVAFQVRSLIYWSHNLRC